MSRLDRAIVFAALGDPVRLALLANIGAGGSIKTLAANMPITRQAVTRHLQVLERAALVASQKQGRETIFVARPARLEEAKKWLDDVAQQWDNTLERLKVLAEKDQA